jgi:hypothetical protein
LTKEAPGRYDATECPGQPFLWLSARESARTRALSGGSPLGRVVLGALDFLGQALGWGATADAAFFHRLAEEMLERGLRRLGALNRSRGRPCGRGLQA